MLLFLRTVLMFALLVVVVYPILVIGTSMAYKHDGFGNVHYALGYHGHLWSRVRDSSVRAPVDVLVVGSSLAYRGCDPRLFAEQGLHMFNLGSSAQTAAQGEVLLRHHLHRLRPRTVVMIVSPDMFEGPGMESALDVMVNDRVDLVTIRMALLTGNVKAWNTVLYAWVRQLLALDADFAEPHVAQNGDRYVSGGFVERPNCDHHPSPPRVFGPLAEHQLKAFRRSVAFVKASGARLLLVHPPVTDCCRPASAPPDVALEWTNAGPYMDMSDLFGSADSAFFCDGRHLNRAGVVRFNSALIRAVEQE
jgi:hypothetical protein